MLLLTESFLRLGHWRYPWQCPQGLFHHSQEGAGWSPSHFINMLQPSQTTQLQQEEHSARQTTLCYQYEHRLWALLTQFNQDNLHRRVVLNSLNRARGSAHLDWSQSHQRGITQTKGESWRNYKRSFCLFLRLDEWCSAHSLTSIGMLFLQHNPILSISPCHSKNFMSSILLA